MIKLINEQKYKWLSKSKLERWKAHGQGWIYINSQKRSPLRRFLSWLRQRAPFGNGTKNRTIFIANGSSTPQKWNKTRQQDFKSCPTPKFITTYKDRAKGWYI